MSHENIAHSLTAVEQALAYVAKSLDRGGFSAGAPAYQRMAEVVVSQAIWLQRENEQGLNGDFRRIEALARDVHRQIHPYVLAMEKLLALEEILPRTGEPVAPDTLAGQIIEILTEAKGPLSMTAIRTAVGTGSRVVRAELDGLVISGIVEQIGSTNRPRYRLAGEQ